MSTAAPQKISNNYFDGLPVTGPHKAIFFIIMMAYFCEQMDNWNFGFIAPALMHSWGLTLKDIGTVNFWYFAAMTTSARAIPWAITRRAWNPRQIRATP